MSFSDFRDVQLDTREFFFSHGYSVLGDDTYWKSFESILTDVLTNKKTSQDLQHFLNTAKLVLKRSSFEETSIEDVLVKLKQYNNFNLICSVAELNLQTNFIRNYKKCIEWLMNKFELFGFFCCFPSTPFFNAQALNVQDSKIKSVFLMQQTTDGINIHLVHYQCKQFIRDAQKASRRWPFEHFNSKEIKNEYEVVYPDAKMIENASSKVLHVHQYVDFFSRVMKSCFNSAPFKLFHAKLIGKGSYAIVGEIQSFFDCVENQTMVLETPVVIRLETCGYDTFNYCQSNMFDTARILNNQRVKIVPTMYFAAFLAFREQDDQPIGLFVSSTHFTLFRQISIWEFAGSETLKTMQSPMKQLNSIIFCCMRVVQLWVWGFAHFDLSVNNIMFSPTETVTVEFTFLSQHIRFSSQISDALLIDLEEVVQITPTDLPVPYYKTNFIEPLETALPNVSLDEYGNWFSDGNPVELSELESWYDLFYPKVSFEEQFPLLNPACASLLLFLNSVRYQKHISPLIRAFAKQLTGSLLFIQTPQELFTSVRDLVLETLDVEDSSDQPNQPTLKQEIDPTFDPMFDKKTYPILEQSFVW